MDNIIEIINAVNSINKKQDTPPQPEIPKEILNQYPYGQFPSRYTKAGQEEIIHNSQNRYLNEIKPATDTQPKTDTDILSLLPILEIITNKNNDNTMKVLSKILFKDNPDIQKLFNLVSHKNKPQEINDDKNFPNTNKVKISSLKKI